MEDAKPSASSNSSRSGDGGSEARFAELCMFDLSLDEKTRTQAMALLQESRHLLSAPTSSFGGRTPDEMERFWFACVLFSVKRLGDSHDSKRLSLCQILRATKLNVVDFCKEMPQFFLNTGPVLRNMYGADWEKKLEVKEMQANFVHLSVLGNYYKRAYGQFFLATDANSEKGRMVTQNSGYVSDYHRFGWLLFLLLRVHGRFKDLVTSTNGLVSILGILILHVPIHYRKFSMNDCPLLARKSEKGVDIIASLCNMYQTSENEIRSISDTINKLIANILKKKPCLASDCKSENLNCIDTDGLIYFDGLMEGESLSSSLLILEKHYDAAIYDNGELDERIFVNDEDSLVGTGSLSGGCIKLSSTKRKFDAEESPAKTVTSPLGSMHSCAISPPNGSVEANNLKIASTPVSTAMATAKWLRTAISSLGSKPSVELERYLSSCDNDVRRDVMHRAHVILEAIFPGTQGGLGVAGGVQNASTTDSIWAEQRRMEALKLYYRVLEAICRAESRTSHGSNLTSLLSNERFHRCMLACSAELVLATHKTTTMLFPAVLERTGISAFDLSKVIESFVRHEDSLPRELKRHLNSLEERLLESLAWEKGSTFYNSLIVARPALAVEINRMGLLAEPMPSLDSIGILHKVSNIVLPTPLLPLPRNEVPSDQNGEIQSPKRVSSDHRSVLVRSPEKDGLAFASPVKDSLPMFSTPKSKLSVFSTPKSKLPPPLQSAFASPARLSPAGGGETFAETGIQVFFSKIVKLAAIRIKCLCERLQLSQEVTENVYCFMQQILNQRTALFFNRHVDQLILCSIYGVAKISKLKLTFKEIIINYRKQPHCKPHVFCSVFVDWSSSNFNGKTGQDHVDIITFYNEIFIPAAKPLLVELGPVAATHRTIRAPDGQCPESPRLSPFPRLPDMSPKKVTASHNVYVSPLRSSKMDRLISPSSKSYYACVGESTHAYQSPSKDLSAINNRLNSDRKVNVKLNFDAGLDSDSMVMNVKLNFDAGLVSDSMVASSLYPQKNGRAI